MSSLGGKLLRLERAAARRGACLIPAQAKFPFDTIPSFAYIVRKHAPERRDALADLERKARAYRLLVRAGLPPDAPWPEEHFERVPPALERAAAELREWCERIERLAIDQCWYALASLGLADWDTEEGFWTMPGEGDETGESPEASTERAERALELLKSGELGRIVLGRDFDLEAACSKTQLHREAMGFGANVYKSLFNALRDLLDEEG